MLSIQIVLLNEIKKRGTAWKQHAPDLDMINAIKIIIQNHLVASLFGRKRDAHKSERLKQHTGGISNLESKLLAFLSEKHQALNHVELNTPNPSPGTSDPVRTDR